VFPRESAARANASLIGTVTDESGGVIVGATISVRQTSTSVERHTQTNSAGRYQVAELNVGSYRMVVRAAGFTSQVVEVIGLEVGRTAVQDFVLTVGEVAQDVTVTSAATIADRATFTVGRFIDRPTIEATPLNGRYFVDLGLLAPGSVMRPQTAQVARPTRGLGTLGINTAGNREDTANFLINGITLNDQITNILMFQPTLGVIQSSGSTRRHRAPNTDEVQARWSISSRDRAATLFTALCSSFFETALWTRGITSAHSLRKPRHFAAINLVATSAVPVRVQVMPVNPAA